MARLLAMKLKLKSMRKVFNLFGNDLSIIHPTTRQRHDFRCPNLANTPIKFLSSPRVGPLEPLKITEWVIRTINSL
jgi:hypothetical protein